jgi:hypothetical protein
MNRQSVSLLVEEYLSGDLEKNDFIKLYNRSTKDYGFLVINNNSIKENDDLNQIYGIIKHQENTLISILMPLRGDQIYFFWTKKNESTKFLCILSICKMSAPNQFKLDTNDILGFSYEEYVSSIRALALSKPDEYFKLRRDVLQKVKKDAVGNLYKSCLKVQI